MFKHLNRGISTLVAIGIIAVLVVVVGGGILAYQYYYIIRQEAKNPVIEIPQKETAKEEAQKMQDLVITTDKISYGADGKINITVRNQNDVPMWYSMDECRCSRKPGFELESYENGDWGGTGVSTLGGCHTGPCIGYLKINPNEEIKVEVPFTLMPSYNYRLKLETAKECDQYNDCNSNNTKEIYSNSFSIKEQPGSINKFVGVLIGDSQCNTIAFKANNGIFYGILGTRS